MTHKNIRNIFIWVLAALALFLVVPFVFQEDIGGKNGSGASMDGEGLLPVVSSENPLTKYMKKLAEFYGLKKKEAPARNSFAEGDGYYEEGLVYMKEAFDALLASPKEGSSSYEWDSGLSDEEIDSVRAAYGKGDGISLERGTVIASPGLVLKPSLSGYSIEGKFYKNGTYPSLKDKRNIEKALSKFHKEKAAQKGLTAAYVRNPDGSLSVKYMSPGSLAAPVSGNLYASNTNRDRDYYRGARIISRKDSDPSSAEGRLSGGSSKKGDSSSFDDIETAYESLSNRIREYLNDKEASSEEEKTQGDPSEQNLSRDLIANSNRAPVSLLMTSQLRQSPNKIPSEEYLNAPIVALRLPNIYANIGSVSDLLRRYGIKDNLNFREKQLPIIAPGTSREEIREIMSEWGKTLQELKSEEGLLRVFSPAMIPDTVFTGGNNDPDIYVGYPRVPYMDINRAGQPVPTSFSEVFLNRTGLSNMLYAMGGPQGVDLDVAALQERYYALDNMRGENNKYLQTLGENKALRKQMPKVVFYLGKMAKNEGNVAVASPSSFLYVYAPNMAPDFILGGDKMSSFRQMPAEIFLDNVNESGSNNIVIVNDDKIKDTLNKAGVKNVSVIETDRLSSGTPEDVAYVIGILKDVVKQRVMSDEALKQEFIKIMKEADKKEKGKK